MHRFFIAPDAVSGREARIEGEDVQHIAKVLRLNPGDTVSLCDGHKMEYTACIEHIERERVVLQILSQGDSKAEPNCMITLYQGLPKAGKLETIIQKCVELGVSRIVPFAASRSVVRLTAQEFERKRPRYARVAYEAAKQSRRGIVPEVCGLTALSAEDFNQYDATLLAYEEEHGKTLKAALNNVRPVDRLALIIGPEGGFAPEEVALLQASGAVSVSLGPRILRTETAGMAAVAMALYELEF